MEVSLEDKFKNWSKKINEEGSEKIPKDTPDEDMLELYSLFKQGSIGDVNIDAPGIFSYPKTKAKYNAWAAKKGMDKETA
jgi:diazepam-binding inhibitor (GABA receptor modulating acyl-CoA-binding protein)